MIDSGEGPRGLAQLNQLDEVMDNEVHNEDEYKTTW